MKNTRWWLGWHGSGGVRKESNSAISAGVHPLLGPMESPGEERVSPEASGLFLLLHQLQTAQGNGALAKAVLHRKDNRFSSQYFPDWEMDPHSRNEHVGWIPGVHITLGKPEVQV